MSGMAAAFAIAGIILTAQWAEKRDINFFAAIGGLTVLGFVGFCVLSAMGIVPRL